MEYYESPICYFIIFQLLLYFFYADTKESEEEVRTRNPNSIAFSCEECGKTLYMTPIEILKHKKSHKTAG